MKEKLFIDTWGWIVIHNKREPKYAKAGSKRPPCGLIRLTGN